MSRLPARKKPTGRLGLPESPGNNSGATHGSGRLRLPDPPPQLDIQVTVIDSVTLSKSQVWGESTKIHWQYKPHEQKPVLEAHLRLIQVPAETVKGLWQATVLRPPSNLAGWQNPPGLVAQGRIATLNDGSEFDIAFQPRLPGPGRLMLPGDTPDPQLYFVRVVILNLEGDPVAPPSLPITIASEPFRMEYSAEDLEAQDKARRARWIQVTHITFEPRVYAPPDAHQRFILTCEMPMIFPNKKIGDQVILTPDDDDSLMDKVSDAVGEIADFVTSATNWVSNAWDSIKASVVNTIADDILNCGDDCRWAVQMAMDSGLAAMGMPPSLPNFDQLVQMGKGYMVETLVAEVSAQSGVAVPPELVEEAVETMIKQAQDIADHGPAGNQCLRPDPAAQARAPMLHTEITNAGPETSPLMPLKVDHSLYLAKTPIIPPLQPGQTLKVPVLLNEPDYESRWAYISDEWKHSQFESTRMRLLKENWGQAYWEEQSLLITLGKQERKVGFKMDAGQEWKFDTETV